MIATRKDCENDPICVCGVTGRAILSVRKPVGEFCRWKTLTILIGQAIISYSIEEALAVGYLLQEFVAAKACCSRLSDSSQATHLRQNAI